MCQKPTFIDALSMPLSSSTSLTSSFLALCCFTTCCAIVKDLEDYYENRPYEFSFNIVDFQHRYEKKDIDGIITGEYGFITADGVYHETGYATDKNGNFIITRMRNRKITNLKDAQEVFKDRPEAAKKLLEAVAKSCGGCKIPIKSSRDENASKISTKNSEPSTGIKVEPILKEMVKVLTENVKKEYIATNAITKSTTVPKKNENERKERVLHEMVKSAKKIFTDNPSRNDIIPDETSLEKLANDLYYRFNYTITSHGHHESGYRSGNKDGSYRARSEDGVDTRVKYVSNEFGHQPNITFHSRSNETKEGEQSLKGYSFLWYFS
ncbi:hypothetical protein KPH14_001844 [Odynerus spinipes]|uniref:Protein lethal(3)malignant blood neoplasm 1 n=1 Tax=Odynerus spinipes TaxID=1348599 RepID=A0AAD9VXF3_9HYME|nr:hypothetical protein KPH14_001844 [Odynerus spinipes]